MVDQNQPGYNPPENADSELFASSETQRSIRTGDVNRGVVGNIRGRNVTVSFGDSYLAYSAVLLRQELYLIPDGSDQNAIVAPSNIEHLLNTLQNSHLIILYAPAFWRSSYVAEYLASEISRLKTDEPLYYSLTSEASGDALLDALRDNNNQLEDAVILASGVLPEKYKGLLLPQLAQQATHRGAYLILTTEEQKWDKGQRVNEGQFIDLTQPSQSPYTTADLASWLLKSADLKAWFAQADIQRLSAGDTIPSTGMSLEKVAAELASPGALQQFLNEVRNPENQVPSSKIQTLVNRVKEQRERSVEYRIEEWFKDLDDSEKYLVLAISLLDGLQQETFWAIYEQLTQHAWRERNMQLTMSDYHNIKVKLDQFVSATGDRVSFHNPEERRKLVAYALDGYRRSLVQALPVLADIVSGANQPVAHETGSLAGRLRVLDIFGSELEPTGENRLRQERLRNSVANSIAQIAQREPSTTEHLLLAWASGVGDPESDIINMRLRIAVIITLVQMLTIVAPTPKGDGQSWYQRHTAFKLLEQWYQRYDARRNVAFSQTALATEERHRNIRGTMALALCHLGRHMTADDFGAFAGEELPTRKVPPKQPEASDLKSAWHMLLALAWDPDSYVRSSILEGIPLLAQRHLEHAEVLIRLLATDWGASVRIQVAELLTLMYARDASRIYIVNSMLSNASTVVDRGVPHDAGHYMRREAEANQRPYPLHLWTATMTMFFIGQRDEAAFLVYLDTLPPYNVQNPLWMALEDVIRFVLSDEEMVKQLQDTTLLYLLTHKAADNSPSQVSQMLANEIRTYVEHPPIERNTASFRTGITATARGYYRGLSEPEITRLRNELSHVRVRNEHIYKLLENYASSNEKQVRRRIQHILYVQDSYVKVN